MWHQYYCVSSCLERCNGAFLPPRWHTQTGCRLSLCPTTAPVWLTIAEDLLVPVCLCGLGCAPAVQVLELLDKVACPGGDGLAQQMFSLCNTVQYSSILLVSKLLAHLKDGGFLGSDCRQRGCGHQTRDRQACRCHCVGCLDL